MRTVHRFLFFVFVLFSLAAAGCDESDDPTKVTKATSISINESMVYDLHRPLTVLYSAAMVKADAVGKDITDPALMPFSLTPAVQGKGYWSSETSFTFVPENGYAGNTQYYVIFKKDLKDLAGNPVRRYHSFATRGNSVRNFNAGSFDAVKNRLELSLVFERPVTSAQLKEHLRLTDPQTNEALPVEIPADRESTVWGLQAELGKYRPALTLRLTADTAKDPAPLALQSETTLNVKIPDPSVRGEDSLAQVVADNKSKPSDISINSAYAYDNGGGQMQAVVYLSHDVTDQDFSEVIRTDPPLPFTVSGSRILLSENLEPGKSVRVTLLPGLVDGSGRVLRETREHVVGVGNRSSAARFSEQGTLFTPVYGAQMGVDVVNVDKVVVSLRRVYDNNLPLIGLENEFSGFDPTKKIVVKEVEISGEQNQILHRSIDPAAMAGGARGVYIIRLESYKKDGDSNEEYYYNSNTEERVVVVSDIGLTARVFPSGISVFAAGLSTGKPLPGASIKVYSASNQLLCEGRADAGGILFYKRETPWEEDLMPHIVTAAVDNDVTFLPMQENTGLTLTAEGTRDYLDTGYEAFVYTPRGVFRPGETVDLKTFVRKADHSAPTPFPVMFAVTSSRGLETARGSVELSEYGAADFRFALPHSAPTGRYTVTVFVPGKEKEPLGSETFQVEDFVPPRLEVGVTPEKTVFVGAEAMKVALSGRYLFGAPGANRPYELGWKITPVEFAPEGYTGWSFKDLDRTADPQTSLRHLTGQLNAEGRADVSFTAPSDWLPPSMLRVMLIGGVQEDGGRWTTKTESITWFPQSMLLGLKVPDGDKDAGKPFTVQAVALTPDGKPADAGSLTVELYRLHSYWSTVYRGGRTTYVWNERKVREARFEVQSADGKAEFPVKPRDHGTYLVRCMAADGKVVSSQRFDVWGSYGMPPSGEGAGRLDQIELTFDKKGYEPGETAKLSIKAPFAGTLVLGVERSEQLSMRVVNMTAPSVQVEIPVTAQMTPNAIVTAWVYRPIEKTEKNWFSHRAFGSANLSLAATTRELKVEATLPERATPSQSVRIPLKVSDSRGNPVQGEFSVALIDEGILSLTTFSTPDPKDFFLALRRAVGRSYDAYDRLIKPDATASAPLIPGGDGTEDYQGSLSSQQVFLTSYLPKVVTGPDGTAEAVFDLPEYSGKGRLMIVGASAQAFASKAEPLRIARDVTLEVTAPRAVAPGDAFEIPLNVFSVEGAASGTAEISVTAEGPIKLSGDVKAQAPLGEAKPRNFLVKGEALNEAGVAAITAVVTVPGREDLSFTRRVEMVVRPPYPRSAAVTSILLKEGEEKEIRVPGEWLKGGFSLAFSVDATPVLSILPVLEYLREYPYGCLEQTTSRAWPYLTLESIQTTLAGTKDTRGIEANTKIMLRDAVDRISSMQAPSGGFAMWPGGGTPRPWLSVNAIYILVEAKSRVAVNPNTLKRSLDYLEYLLGAPETAFDGVAQTYTTKAYAAFVLTRAGKAPLSRLQTLSEHTGKMYPSGRLFLAAAKSLAAGNSKALEALSSKDLIHTSGNGWNSTLESPVRNTALELLAWSLVDPGHKHTLETAVRLADMINANRWYTTQEAGMASLAVGTFLEKTSTRQDFTALIQLGDAAPVTASKRRIFGDGEIPLGAGDTPAVIKATAKNGMAYCVYSVRGVPLQEPKRPENTGILVSREWLGPDGKALDLSKGAVTLKQGDRVTVNIEINIATPTPDVVLSDLTPGGMEVENPRLESAARDEESDGDETGGSGYDIHLDLREDRVLVFFDQVADTVKYSYSMRAVSKGAFIIPPTAVEGMYNPERNDIAPSGRLIIE